MVVVPLKRKFPLWRDNRSQSTHHQERKKVITVACRLRFWHYSFMDKLHMSCFCFSVHDASFSQYHRTVYQLFDPLSSSDSSLGKTSRVPHEQRKCFTVRLWHVNYYNPSSSLPVHDWSKLTTWSKVLLLYSKCLFTWKWGTPGKWGNPPRRGRIHGKKLKSETCIFKSLYIS